MQNFRDLRVWQKAHRPALDVYRESSRFPGAELYGLTAQMRRAAVSVGANIAEGCCRQTSPDFARFLQIAMGSAGELEYHIILAGDLNHMPPDVAQRLASDVVEVKRMLASPIPKVRRARPSRTHSREQPSIDDLHPPTGN